MANILAVQPNNQWFAPELHRVVGISVENACKELGVDSAEIRNTAIGLTFREILNAVWPAGNC